jgi:hypothetical protein
MNLYGNNISEYLRYKRLINGFSAESHWKVLLQQVFIPQKIDPYLYLDRYLTDYELQEVLSLPHQSKGQVDKIIAFVDEYNVCEDELRSLVYRLFNVS